MATIKSYIDIEQSKKLADILPLESADMRYYLDDEYPKLITKYEITYANVLYGSYDIRYFNIFEYTPCWNLAALLKVLPEIQGGKPIIALDDNYITYPHMSDLHTKADNLVDACYEMILKLHERKML